MPSNLKRHSGHSASVPENTGGVQTPHRSTSFVSSRQPTQRLSESPPPWPLGGPQSFGLSAWKLPPPGRAPLLSLTSRGFATTFVVGRTLTLLMPATLSREDLPQLLPAAGSWLHCCSCSQVFAAASAAALAEEYLFSGTRGHGFSHTQRVEPNDTVV